MSVVLSVCLLRHFNKHENWTICKQRIILRETTTTANTTATTATTIQRRIHKKFEIIRTKAKISVIEEEEYGPMYDCPEARARTRGLEPGLGRWSQVLEASGGDKGAN